MKIEKEPISGQYGKFKINGIEFQSKVFEGHDHGTNFFGERFGPMIVYLLYSKESA